MSLIQIYVTAFTVVAARSAFKPFNKLQSSVAHHIIDIILQGKDCSPAMWCKKIGELCTLG